MKSFRFWGFRRLSPGPYLERNVHEQARTAISSERQRWNHMNIAFIFGGAVPTLTGQIGRESKVRNRCLLMAAAAVLFLALAPGSGVAQVTPAPTLGSNCTAMIANRSVAVNDDRTFAIPNIPTDVGFYRVRVICKNPDGTTTPGQSSFVSLRGNGNTSIPSIVFGTITPAPISIAITSPLPSLATMGHSP